MTLRKLMQEAKQNLLKEKRSLEKLLSDAPPGMLIYSRNTANNKVYCKWYVSSCDKFGKRSKTYIPNKDRGLARELALKRLRLKRLDDVKSQLRAIDSFLAKYREHSDLNDLLDAPMLGNLLAEERKPAKELAEELKRWEEEEYETDPSFPERRTVPTVDDIKVRSKSEALIVMLLSTLHIPYRYNCRLDIGGHVYYPDFTIRHPVTGRFYYWEHEEMLDHPACRSDFLTKLRIYMGNGILPDHNLILTYESGDDPLDITIAQDKIREFFDCEAAQLY